MLTAAERDLLVADLGEQIERRARWPLGCPFCGGDLHPTEVAEETAAAPGTPTADDAAAARTVRIEFTCQKVGCAVRVVIPVRRDPRP